MMNTNGNATSTEMYKDGPEFFLHFIYIFACLFALVRLTHLVETFVTSLIQKKIDAKKREDEDFRILELFERIKALEVKTTNIIRQMDSIEKLRCYEAKTELLNGQQNIFISNRYFNLNQITPANQILQNQTNGFHSSEGETIRKVWQKYFALQNSKPRASNLGKMLTSDPNYNPLSKTNPQIVSTEQLQAMRGFDN